MGDRGGGRGGGHRPHDPHEKVGRRSQASGQQVLFSAAGPRICNSFSVSKWIQLSLPRVRGDAAQYVPSRPHLARFWTRAFSGKQSWGGHYYLSHGWGLLLDVWWRLFEGLMTSGG